MKKILFLSLLVVSSSVFAGRSSKKDKNGHLATYKNLSPAGKKAYKVGYIWGALGQTFEEEWNKENHKDSFSLGFLNGKIRFLDKKFSK